MISSCQVFLGVQHDELPSFPARAREQRQCSCQAAGKEADGCEAPRAGRLSCWVRELHCLKVAIVLQIECEANAFAKLLAAASRSLTPQSPQGSPLRHTTPNRCPARQPSCPQQHHACTEEHSSIAVRVNTKPCLPVRSSRFQHGQAHLTMVPAGLRCEACVAPERGAPALFRSTQARGNLATVLQGADAHVWQEVQVLAACWRSRCCRRWGTRACQRAPCACQHPLHCPRCAQICQQESACSGCVTQSNHAINLALQPVER